MNLKAIAASLILGSSSLAMAQPAQRIVDDNCEPTAPAAQPVYNQPVYGQPVYGQPAYGQPAYGQPVYGQPAYGQPVYSQPVYSPPIYSPPIYSPPAQPGRWRRPPVFSTVTLASNMHFTNQGRTFITVGSQAGRFGSLQLSAAGAPTFIQQVYVEFDNGQEQVIRNLNRTLAGHQSLTVDLDGNRRAIRRVVVYGRDLNNGWRGAAGGFTLSAA
jgi:hypothetical protein